MKKRLRKGMFLGSCRGVPIEESVDWGDGGGNCRDVAAKANTESLGRKNEWSEPRVAGNERRNNTARSIQEIMKRPFKERSSREYHGPHFSWNAGKERGKRGSGWSEGLKEICFYYHYKKSDPEREKTTTEEEELESRW